MSLDLELGNATFNYTYNLSYVWCDIFPDADGMVDIEGLTGDEAELVITVAISNIEYDYDRLRADEPENGWGDLDSFYLWLCKLKLECVKQPNEIWRAYR